MTARLKQGLLVSIIAALSIVFAEGFHSTNVGERLELHGYDILFGIRKQATPPGDLVVVAIDEPSFAELGLQWPWPRRIHADLIRKLSAAGARLIVLDVLFGDTSDKKNDTALAAAIKQAGNVVLAGAFDVINREAYVEEIWLEPVFAKWALAVGAADLPRDPDGFVRRAAGIFKGKQTLGWTAAQLVSGRAEAPDEFLINFSGPPGESARTVSYYQALQHERFLPKDIFRDRTVFVGLALSVSPDPRTSIPDSYPTPGYSWRGQTMPGVEIQANIVDTILRGKPIREALRRERFAGLLVYALLSSLGFAFLRPVLASLCVMALASVFLAVFTYVFHAHNVWFPAATLVVQGCTLLIGHNINKYFSEEKEKRRVRRTFERYMHPSLVREVLACTDTVSLAGKGYEGTVMFTDLVGFTSIAEKMPPAELVTVLNEYFSLMVEEIFRCKGVVDKFVGDAIMAFWGIPLPNRSHATDACLAALAMQDRLKAFDEGLRTRGFPNLGMRIGIHTGQVVAGNVGSHALSNFTVMGDTVNLASRLEGANKQYGTHVMISESTYASAREVIEARELDRIAVKGKEVAVAVYELRGTKGQMDRKESLMMGAWAEAIALYRSRRWEEAIEGFARVLAAIGEDGPSHVYIQRCQQFRLNPPADDWDGVFRLTAK